MDSADSCFNYECLNSDFEEGEGECDMDIAMCPKWTSQDERQNHSDTVEAKRLSVYAFSALRFGLDLRRAQSKYQIAYV
jgi:hypothetical protein